MDQVRLAVGHNMGGTFIATSVALFGIDPARKPVVKRRALYLRRRLAA